MTYAQLRLTGWSERQIERSIERGDLTRTRPRVYAVGYVRTDDVALLWEAVLYAGPGAYLTGASAAHHLGLILYRPREIIVATPRRCRSVPGIRVIQKRPAEHLLFRDGMPVAAQPEMMVQLAADETLKCVRLAISGLDFHRWLDRKALLDACGKGRPGSVRLRRAIYAHLPQLAHCRSELEIDFILLLDAHHLTLPEVNVMLHGILVDMYWPDLGLVVELDGTGNHGTAAQKREDARRAAILRGHGLTVIRFASDDVNHSAAGTLTALRRAGVTLAS